MTQERKPLAICEQLIAVTPSRYLDEPGYDGPPMVLLNPNGHEAKAIIEGLVEAVDYARKELGDPVPISRRHVARKLDAALEAAGAGR